MVEIRWSPLATDDYESIIRYYEKTAPKFAQNSAIKIIFIIENLSNFLKMGRIVPELESGEIREIVYRNFRIIYRLKENILEIARIIHGSRSLRI
jgi:plasmid stabilization system protein ParE